MGFVRVEVAKNLCSCLRRIDVCSGGGSEEHLFLHASGEPGSIRAEMMKNLYSFAPRDDRGPSGWRWRRTFVRSRLRMTGVRPGGGGEELLFVRISGGLRSVWAEVTKRTFVRSRLRRIRVHPCGGGEEPLFVHTSGGPGFFREEVSKNLYSFAPQEDWGPSGWRLQRIFVHS
ncbi:hypothetical protein KSP40_PGU019879 [Platanthera guangdongensis]|uniref:Uncharacterized protein n=1 Tax=Platanthera guangdongensis TaxID=2320717 RepID=A0ABR2LKP3_9ASPA